MRETIKEYKGFKIVRDKEEAGYVYYAYSKDFRYLKDTDVYFDDVKEDINEDYVKRFEEMIDEIRKKYTRQHKLKGETYFNYFGEFPAEDYGNRTPDEAARFFIIDKCSDSDISISRLIVNYSSKKESAFVDINDACSLMRMHHIEKTRFDRIKLEGKLKSVEHSKFRVEYDYEDMLVRIFTDKEHVADKVAETLGLYEFKKHLKANPV